MRYEVQIDGEKYKVVFETEEVKVRRKKRPKVLIIRTCKYGDEWEEALDLNDCLGLYEALAEAIKEMEEAQK